jgi:hypothetical protein
MLVLSFDVGTKNLALCKMKLMESSFEVLLWTVESTVDSKVNVNTTGIAELAPPFYEWLLKKAPEWITDVDHSFKSTEGPAEASKGPIMIFIENQPMGLRGGARNLKTKVLSHILQVVLHNLVPTAQIHFVNPSLKLKDMVRSGPSSYKENKKYAVLKTSELINSEMCASKDCVKIFEKEKKKDDLADSFLQGLIAGQMHLAGNVIESIPKARKSKKSESTTKTPKTPKTPKSSEPSSEPDLKTAEDKPKAKKNLKEKSRKRTLDETLDDESIEIS